MLWRCSCRCVRLLARNRLLHSCESLMLQQQMTRMRDAAVQLLVATSAARDSLARHNHLMVLELQEAHARVRVLQVCNCSRPTPPSPPSPPLPHPSA